MKREARAVPLDWAVLLGLCALGVVLGRMQGDARARGEADMTSRVVATVVSPLTNALTATANGTSDFFGGVFSAHRLTAENRALRGQLTAMRLYDERIRGLEKDLAAMRQALRFRTPPGRVRVPAAVVGYFPFEHRAVLDVGTAQGVRAGMPVVAPEGLLGTVRTVESGRCHVLLLTSPGDERVLGALVRRDPPAAGLLYGQGASLLSLVFGEPGGPVRVGDVVTTSGFSEHIPRGIPIGWIVAMENNEAFGTRRGLVMPYAAIGTAREVVVLR